jgi:hypothetical protein
MDCVLLFAPGGRRNNPLAQLLAPAFTIRGSRTWGVVGQIVDQSSPIAFAAFYEEGMSIRCLTGLLATDIASAWTGNPRRISLFSCPGGN